MEIGENGNGEDNYYDPDGTRDAAVRAVLDPVRSGYDLQGHKTETGSKASD